MKHLLLIPVFWLSLLAAHGQEGYYDVRSGDRKVIYFDGYDDDRNGLAGRMPDLKLDKKIENGCLTMETWDRSQGKYTYVTVELDPSQDFELETRIRFEYGEDTYGLEFQWGKDQDGSNFGFHVSGNAQYWIGKYERGSDQYVPFVPWTPSPLVNGRSWNKITIRKVKSTYYMFLNETLVHTRPFQALFGHRIAYLVPQNTKMSADYLQVAYLNRNTTPTQQSAAIPEPPQPAVSLYEPKGKRVALIIGNKNYLHVAPLQNTLNDAMDMSKTLKSQGFEVISVYDAKTKREIRDAVVRFNTALNGQQDAVGLLYYSGHGMQVDGSNYLIPVGAELQIKADIEDQCFNVDYLLQAMEETGNALNIVILDACRSNPFKGFSRSTEKGLRSIDAPKGSYIVYATKPGDTASDGEGRNGLFTSKLLKYINTKGMSLEQVFKNVAREVAQESADDQRPWISSDFTGDFHFAR